jgi:short-subunit dehydrogenase
MSAPQTQNFLLLGAGSAIARAVAAELAAQKASLLLAGRNLADLEAVAADLRVRHGVSVAAKYFDALDTARHGEFFTAAVNECGEIHGVVLAFGTMTDQKEAERDFARAEAMIASNYIGAVSVLTHAANYFEARKSGVIAVISSVAGDRGRQSNYVYGSAKGALSLFTQGLRNRLCKSGVRVVTIKPGFVDTPMTYGMKLPPIVASPRFVARDICAALRTADGVVYTPFFWRYIMLVIRLIPEFLFKKLNL